MLCGRGRWQPTGPGRPTASADASEGPGIRHAQRCVRGRPAAEHLDLDLDFDQSSQIETLKSWLKT